MGKKASFIYFITLILLFASCKRDEPTRWDANELFPLATANLSLSNLINDSLISTDEDGLIHFSLNESLTDFDIDSLVRIPDTSIVKSFSPPLLGGPFELAPGTQVLTLQEDNEFAVNTAFLRRARIKEGTLLYQVRSYIDGQLSIEYKLPGVKLDGQALEIEGVTLAASDANPYLLDGEIDLSNYEFDFTGQNGDAFNTLYSQMNIEVDQNATESAQVYGSDSIAIELHFVDPVVEYALGYFGHHTYNLQDTISFEAMQNIVSGGLDIGEIDLSLNIDNYVGTDAQIQINTLGSYNSLAENNVPLSNSSLENTINLTRAYDNNGIVEPTLFNIELDEVNSNLDNFIENLPDELILDMVVEINPLGDVSAGNDFIYTNQPLQAVMEIDMPMCIRADELVLQDTLTISSEDIELNADGELHIYAENAFPFEAHLQLEIVNKEGEVLEELFTSNTLASGIYSSVDYSTEAISSVLDIAISDETFENINSDNRFVLHITFDTTGEVLIKFQEEHYLDIKIVADIKAEIGYN